MCVCITIVNLICIYISINAYIYIIYIYIHNIYIYILLLLLLCECYIKHILLLFLSFIYFLLVTFDARCHGGQLLHNYNRYSCNTCETGTCPVGANTGYFYWTYSCRRYKNLHFHLMLICIINLRYHLIFPIPSHCSLR